MRLLIILFMSCFFSMCTWKKVEQNILPVTNKECDCIVDDHLTDGEILGIQPGQTICLEGGRTYGPLLFKNINGTAEQPIEIRNCNGDSKVYSENSFGVKFEDSEHFKFSGVSQKPLGYGITITTENGFYLTMEHFTTDFEISGIEVKGASNDVNNERSGFAGIGVKTSPYVDCDLFSDPTRKAWVMKNIKIHDNYIHHVGGEGMYIGHGFYKGRKEGDCSQLTYSHSIQGLRIYDNLVEHVGYDGMQIKNADVDVEVYKNQIRNYGLKDTGVHNEGLFIGEGTTGKFYNNIIENGSGNGIQFQGMGNNDIFNNLIINPGENGLYGTLGTYAIRLEDGYINLFNNTIFKEGSFGQNYAGITFHNPSGGQKRLINNMVLSEGGLLENISVNFQSESNLIEDLSISLLGLISIDLTNLNMGDLQAALTEVGIDKGIDLTEYGIIEDINGVSRPQGAKFDIGAFEN